MSGTSFSLDRDEVVCGRTEGDVRLADDVTVSPRHARFVQAGGVLRVEDLGSVNGTFVRLKEARPVTTLCIRCKEEQEQKEKSFG